MCGANDRLLDELLPAACILAGKCTGFPGIAQVFNSGRPAFCPFLGIFMCSHTHRKHDRVGLALASPTHPEQTHITG